MPMTLPETVQSLEAPPFEGNRPYGSVPGGKEVRTALLSSDTLATEYGEFYVHAFGVVKPADIQATRQSIRQTLTTNGYTSRVDLVTKRLLEEGWVDIYTADKKAVIVTGIGPQEGLEHLPVRLQANYPVSKK